MEPQGKLELLFTHMTINNIHYVKPLIYEAIEEYQTLSRKLSFEEQRKLSILKEFLFHAENGKWDLARHQLHSAEQAYQEYFERKNKILDTDSRSYGYQTGGETRESTSGKRMTSATPFTNSPEGGISRQRHLESRQNSIRAITENTRNSDSRAISGSTRSTNEHASSISGTNKSNRETSEGGGSRPSSYSSSLKQISRSQRSQRLLTGDSQAIKLCVESEETDHSTHSKNAKEDDVVLLTPGQIADQFRCIYDDEWRHALAALSRLGVEKKDAISCLLHIVEECYRLCESEAERQLAAPPSARKSSQTERREDDSKEGTVLLTTDRSKLHRIPVKRLQETFLANILSGWLRYFGIETCSVGEIDAYVRQCIDVTWKMCLQSPPIHLITEKRRDDKTFNPNHYKCYTKYGQVLDFYVWPALLYYVGGPILAKGVAQSR